MAKANYHAQIFNSAFGVEGAKDGFTTLGAAKKYAAKIQNSAGSGWNAEIRDADGNNVAHRPSGVRKFAESI